jgi:UDP-glucuronate decarboxylase
LKEPNQIHVLVTGGAGFLGSHLCERLLKDGQDVVCVDNFYTGSKRNIQCLLQNPFFELLRHDITFPFMWRWTGFTTWSALQRRCIESIER